MATQYIGARYVPIFADPAEWNDTRTYEPLTVVLHGGNSYTSKQYVPVGIEIDDSKFWAETGNYNAQVEQYRQDVVRYATEVNNVSAALNAEVERATVAEKANADAITAEQTRATVAEKANADAITAEVERATVAEKANADAITAEVERATVAEKANADAITAEQTRATVAEKANADAIAAIGATVEFYDPSLGIAQNASNSFMYPFYQSSASMNGMSREDVLKQLYIINGYYNAAINGELVYNNKKTFHFEKDPDNEGNYIPFDVTANLVDGKMAIDCATFTQLVAHSILYSQSPYKKNYYFTSQFGTPYNYLQKNVVKYWEHYYKDHYAGRLLTWQWAKFLSDYGALMLVPNKLLNGTSDSIYTCNGKYIGNYTPQPGDHIFMRSDEVKGTYLSISHCAIIFDAHFKADNTSEVLIVDSANTTDTPNGINIRALSSEDRNRICAVYRPTFGYGFQFVKYHNVTSVKKSDNTLNLTIRYPVEVALRCHASVDHNTVSVKNTDSVGNIISEFESRTMGANNAYTFFAIPGNLELTVNSTSDATYFDVELKNF